MILSGQGFAFGAFPRRGLRLSVSGFGVEGARIRGARCPGGLGPKAARRPASSRNRAASGQADAKWMRMRAAFSTTRAPILSRRALRIANSAQASGILRGTARIVSRWREATPGVCRAGHRSVLVRRRRTVAECHDFGPADESGQSVPVRSGMLKSCGCDTMTGAGESFFGWGSESRERSGLGRSASGRCAPLGKTGRNVCEG